MTRTLPLRSALVVLLAFLAVAPAASARPDSAARLQMVWPASGTVTARFGEWRGSHRHAGIDIGMLRTLRLRSVLAGTVREDGIRLRLRGLRKRRHPRSSRPVHGALRASLARSRPSGSARSQRTASWPRRLHGQLLRHPPPFRDRTARRAGGSSPLPPLRRLSWPPMRSRYLVDGASVVAVALFLGWVLSLATTRVKNSVDRAVQVCAPARRHGQGDGIDARRVGCLPRPDEVRALRTCRPPAGVLIRSIALADERGPVDRCPT